MASNQPLTGGDTTTSIQTGCQECQIQSMHLICGQTNTHELSHELGPCVEVLGRANARRKNVNQQTRQSNSDVLPSGDADLL